MGMTSSKSNAPPSAETLVNDTITSNKIVIFSKSSCGYCDAAKRTFSEEAHRLSLVGCHPPAPKIIELDDGSISPDLAREVQSVLFKMTGEATVPRVFVEGGSVGGAVDTIQYARSGGLKLALMKAGRCEAK